jgi:hypothetical protein
MNIKLFVCCLFAVAVAGCAAAVNNNWEHVVPLLGADSDETGIAVGVSSEACLLSGGTFIMHANKDTLRWKCELK